MGLTACTPAPTAAPGGNGTPKADITQFTNQVTSSPHDTVKADDGSADMPPGITARLESAGASGRTVAMRVEIPCFPAPASFTLKVQAAISGTVRSATANVKVEGGLPDHSQPGVFTGSFKDNTMGYRAGGPSTYEYGSYHVLEFCSTLPGKLRVVVESTISETGSKLAQAPRFSLHRSLEFPAPKGIQTVGGGYTINAITVANSKDGILEWNVSTGPYVLMFHRSPFEDNRILPTNAQQPSCTGWSCNKKEGT